MPDAETSQYPPVYPHGPIRELGPGVFFVPGSLRLAPLMNISRNMTVLRHDGELSLFNAVRLSPAGEAELERLGRVRHVVRLGSFHGLDDAYYVERFGAQFWCQPDSTHYERPEPDRWLAEGEALPVPDTELFVFRETRQPECAVLLRHGAGLLINCDALQHYADFRRHSLAAKLFMRTVGFRRGTVIGPLWLKLLTEKGGSLKPDFERLLQLPFDALLSAHGTPLLTGGKAAAREAVARVNWPESD